ncbi:MAG TPA: HD domain-containing protein [Candidatus Sulfotelmatobacter sp.]
MPPGAGHLRNEHVAGVLWTVAQYVRALYADRSEPFWRIAVNEEDIIALLLAALLHDIGHVAFGHYVEEMEGLVKGRTHVDYVLRVLGRSGSAGTDADVKFVYDDAAQRDHASIGKEIVKAWGIPEQRLGEFLAHVAEILRPLDDGNESSDAAADPKGRLDPERTKRIKVAILHSIIDSAIDADKLDYLFRDAHHCGVHYSEGIDVDRFYQSLTAIPDLSEYRAWARKKGDEGSRPGASIGVTDKGLLPVESMLVARYQMFSCVYWHHTARAYTAMLQFLILSYLEIAKPLETEKRLEDLIRWFRESNDEGALLWLRDELVGGLSGERRMMFTNIAEGMLGQNRQLRYRSAFELQYETGSGGLARETYDGLMSLSRRAAGAQSPAIYVDFCRSLRQTFAESLSLQIRKKTGKNIVFADGEVLIDIPPAGKDQVDNVFVNTRGKVRPVEELSPLSDAVRGAFRYWVRKCRVFLGPSAWEKCDELDLSKEALWDACFAALKDKIVLQLELPFGMDTEKDTQG